MNPLQNRLQEVHHRIQRRWQWQCMSWGLTIGGLFGVLAGAMRAITGDTIPWLAIAVPLVAGPFAGLLYGLYRPRPMREAAVLIDRQCGLKDRMVTAMSFLDHPDQTTPVRQLQIADAESHVSHVNPVLVVPITAPSTWRWGLGLTTAAIAMSIWTAPPPKLITAVVANEVITMQADRLAKALTELAEFNAEKSDPEVQKMLQQLAANIEELRQPGLEPKDALAKLSEMETVVQQKQQQLSERNSESALIDIGAALSLAPPMEGAGQAMSQGQLEKAAEELARLELPTLDRQPELAVVDKLKQLRGENQKNAMPGKLLEAMDQLSLGLSQADRSKFRKGVQHLADECQAQARRKKLADLLRKQCRYLTESKGQCESECKNIAEGNQKGGRNWGLASSGNTPGDRTSPRGTHKPMRITGQDAGRGGSDRETITSEEYEPSLAHEYRAQLQKYQQLAESALDSEPLPLGYRQTIQRYFEMLRRQDPQGDPRTASPRTPD